MTTLVFGGGGMLGQDLARLSTPNRPLVGLSREQGDITDADSVTRALDAHEPDGVIIAAAWTDVDGAESHAEEAHRVNALGPEIVAKACALQSVPVQLISTDYVFSSPGPEPHREDAPVAPLGVYGRTKAEGERRLADAGGVWSVVRTSWLFGIGGPNFPETMLTLAQTRPTLQVVDDQIGAPTYTGHLAQGLLACQDAGLTGVLHLAAAGQTSWCGLAREVFQVAGLEVDVRPCTTEEFPRPAPRPRWSVMDMTTASQAGIALPDWRQGVKDWFAARP